MFLVLQTINMKNVCLLYCLYDDFILFFSRWGEEEGGGREWPLFKKGDGKKGSDKAPWKTIVWKLVLVTFSKIKFLSYLDHLQIYLSYLDHLQIYLLILSKFINLFIYL